MTIKKLAFTWQAVTVDYKTRVDVDFLEYRIWEWEKMNRSFYRFLSKYENHREEGENEEVFFIRVKCVDKYEILGGKGLTEVRKDVLEQQYDPIWQHWIGPIIEILLAIYMNENFFFRISEKKSHNINLNEKSLWKCFLKISILIYEIYQYVRIETRSEHHFMLVLSLSFRKSWTKKKFTEGFSIFSVSFP